LTKQQIQRPPFHPLSGGLWIFHTFHQKLSRAKISSQNLEFSFFDWRVEALSTRFEDLADEELMALYQDGNADALGFLLKRMRTKMDQVARTRILDRELANDALQEACIAIFKTAKNFRGDSKVFTWVYRLVVNACIDQLRKEKAKSSLNTSDEALQTIAQPDFSDQSNSALVIRKALDQIPNDQREAVSLVWIEGYTVEEASEILEIPMGTVKSRCARGKSALAEILKDLRPNMEPDSISKRLTGGGK
jgi:RNA polymerase sigma-70 factor (ECF subfamily)